MQQVQECSWSIPGGEDARESIKLLQSARVHPSSVHVNLSGKSSLSAG